MRGQTCRSAGRSALGWGSCGCPPTTMQTQVSCQQHGIDTNGVKHGQVLFPQCGLLHRMQPALPSVCRPCQAASGQLPQPRPTASCAGATKPAWHGWGIFLAITGTRHLDTSASSQPSASWEAPTSCQCLLHAVQRPPQRPPPLLAILQGAHESCQSACRKLSDRPQSYLATSQFDLLLRGAPMQAGRASRHQARW